MSFDTYINELFLFLIQAEALIIKKAWVSIHFILILIMYYFFVMKTQKKFYVVKIMFLKYLLVNTFIVVQNDTKWLIYAPFLHYMMWFNESSVNYLQNNKNRHIKVTILIAKAFLFMYDMTFHSLLQLCQRKMKGIYYVLILTSEYFAA